MKKDAPIRQGQDVPSEAFILPRCKMDKLWQDYSKRAHQGAPVFERLGQAAHIRRHAPPSSNRDRQACVMKPPQISSSCTRWCRSETLAVFVRRLILPLRRSCRQFG